MRPACFRRYSVCNSRDNNFPRLRRLPVEQSVRVQPRSVQSGSFISSVPPNNGSTSLTFVLHIAIPVQPTSAYTSYSGWSRDNHMVLNFARTTCDTLIARNRGVSPFRFL